MGQDTVVHVVRYGEHLASIALAHGVTPDAIWGHPDNADLVELRDTGHILSPGDVLVVPLAKPKWTSVPVGSTTTLVAPVPTVHVRMKLHDEDGPIANEKYIAHLDEDVEGTTGGDGSVDFEASVLDRVIELELVDRQHTIELHVGGLDPVDTVTGMQTRLHHLQYLEEPATGQMDDDTREALAAFQRDASLPVTGEIDQATFDALRSKYGC